MRKTGLGTTSGPCIGALAALLLIGRSGADVQHSSIGGRTFLRRRSADTSRDIPPPESQTGPGLSFLGHFPVDSSLLSTKSPP